MIDNLVDLGLGKPLAMMPGMPRLAASLPLGPGLGLALGGVQRVGGWGNRGVSRVRVPPIRESFDLGLEPRQLGIKLPDALVQPSTLRTTRS